MMAQPKLLTHLVRNLLNNAMIHGIPPVQVYLYHATNIQEATSIPQYLLDSFVTLVMAIFYTQNQMKQTL